MTAQQAPAGWYDDPNDPGAQRYWDGRAWTSHRQRKSDAFTPPPQSPPMATPPSPPQGAATPPAAASAQPGFWDQVKPQVNRTWDQMQPHVNTARGFWSRQPRQRQILLAAAGLLAIVVIAAGTLMTISSIGGAIFGGPSVDKSALQKDIIKRMHAVMDAPDAVICANDLPGVVGKTANCEVKNSFSGDFEVVATVTRVDGGNVSYDLAPSYTKEQLAQQIQIQNSQTMMGVGGPIQSVSCESGLQAKEGDETHCQYSRDGIQHLTAKVLGVDGLNMTIQFSSDR